VFLALQLLIHRNAAEKAPPIRTVNDMYLKSLLYHLIRSSPTSATGARKGMEAVILLGF
jgi:hypothetical protein